MDNVYVLWCICLIFYVSSNLYDKFFFMINACQSKLSFSNAFYMLKCLCFFFNFVCWYISSEISWKCFIMYQCTCLSVCLFVSFCCKMCTTDLLTPFLIGSHHEMFICSANYDNSLRMLHHKPAQETIFPYTLSDWFNKWQNIHFDQSAGSTHGVSYGVRLRLTNSCILCYILTCVLVFKIFFFKSFYIWCQNCKSNNFPAYVCMFSNRAALATSGGEVAIMWGLIYYTDDLWSVQSASDVTLAFYTGVK